MSNITDNHQTKLETFLSPRTEHFAIKKMVDKDKVKITAEITYHDSEQINKFCGE